MLYFALLLALLNPKLVPLDQGEPAPFAGVLYDPQYHRDVVDKFKVNKAELDTYRLRVPEIIAEYEEEIADLDAALEEADVGLAKAEDMANQIGLLSQRPDNRWSWALLGAGGAVVGGVVPLFVDTSERQALGLVVIGGAIGVLVAWIQD